MSKTSCTTSHFFWDCECKYNYIHDKLTSSECVFCRAHAEDQPDSRIHEIHCGDMSDFSNFYTYLEARRLYGTASRGIGDLTKEFIKLFSSNIDSISLSPNKKKLCLRFEFNGKLDNRVLLYAKVAENNKHNSILTTISHHGDLTWLTVKVIKEDVKCLLTILEDLGIPISLYLLVTELRGYRQIAVTQEKLLIVTWPLADYAFSIYSKKGGFLYKLLNAEGDYKFNYSWHKTTEGITFIISEKQSGGL